MAPNVLRKSILMLAAAVASVAIPLTAQQRPFSVVEKIGPNDYDGRATECLQILQQRDQMAGRRHLTASAAALVARQSGSGWSHIPENSSNIVASSRT
jgi:hypothetical protein